MKSLRTILCLLFFMFSVQSFCNGILPITFENAEYHIKHQENICNYIDVTLSDKHINKGEIKMLKEFKDCKKQIGIVKSMYKLKKKVINQLKKNKGINSESIRNEEKIIEEKIKGIYKYLHLVYDANAFILEI